MDQYRLTASMWVGLSLLGLAGCTSPSTMATQKAQGPPVDPNMARVWFFRQTSDPVQGNVEAGRPVIYANGAPIADIAQGTAFFHNFPPGKYRFTVQPFGTPTREHDTLELLPGSQNYVQVQWEANWEANRTGGGSSFTVLTSSPVVAQQYIPTLTNLGQR